ncbi:hypothetical protein CRG98_039982 [Punica granatum]|uniref:Secreted protein n=1 Tax=Punica granatum TaxID=22663 RepID=A0A2I0I6B1_PUNGR|nr:hypothetical protein CRG98_039982 [Punica granatum]
MTSGCLFVFYFAKLVLSLPVLPFLPPLPRSPTSPRRVSSEVMKIRRCSFNQCPLIFLLSAIMLRVAPLDSVSAACELSVVDRKKLYNYSLVSPIQKFPHGALSEDGYSFCLSFLCTAHAYLRTVYEGDCA